MKREKMGHGATEQPSMPMFVCMYSTNTTSCISVRLVFVPQVSFISLSSSRKLFACDSNRAG